MRSEQLSDNLPAAPAPGWRRGPWLQLRPPKGYEWNRVTLPIRGLPAGLAGYRILHLSDFHFRQAWPEPYEGLIARTQADPPGLILIGGDYVEDKRNYHPGLPNVLRLLSGLACRHGCFGVLGNHDGDIGPAIDGCNITLIDRKRVVLEADGAQIELIGLPRLHKATGPDQIFIDSLPPKAPNVPRIVVSHYSDYLYRTPKAHPDLFLAGHSHGGQVCLPGGIPILKHTSLPRRYSRGIHKMGETWLVANRGLGYSTVSLRLFCPSEVVEIELQPATSSS